MGLFAGQVELVAVQKAAVIDGQAQAARPGYLGTDDHSHRQAIFSRQSQYHLGNGVPAIEAQAVLIEVGRPQPEGQHRFDLRPELHLQLAQIDLGQEMGHLVKVIEGAVGADQGRHFLTGA